MIRVALICPACQKAGHPRRAFGNKGWRCPEHPNVRPVVQANRSYFGKVPGR